jgi:hypothetical protein
MLAKIAVWIDLYDCAEALESFTERWIEYLRVKASTRVLASDNSGDEAR